jgi:hypothetical protein
MDAPLDPLVRGANYMASSQESQPRQQIDLFARDYKAQPAIPLLQSMRAPDRGNVPEIAWPGGTPFELVLGLRNQGVTAQ